LLLVVGCTALAIVVLVITTGKPELALAGAVFVGKALHNFATMWYNSHHCALVPHSKDHASKNKAPNRNKQLWHANSLMIQ